MPRKRLRKDLKFIPDPQHKDRPNNQTIKKKQNKNKNIKRQSLEGGEPDFHSYCVLRLKLSVFNNNKKIVWYTKK